MVNHTNKWAQWLAAMLCQMQVSETAERLEREFPAAQDVPAKGKPHTCRQYSMDTG